MNGNMQAVRDALGGITGVAPEARVEEPSWYMIVVRMSRERDAVDSYRRRDIAAYWPSYESLVKTRLKLNGRFTRVQRRIGMIPGYVFAQQHDDFGWLIDRIIGGIDIVRRSSGLPLMLDVADIDLIKKIENGLNAPSAPPVGKAVHQFKIGEKVRFVDDLYRRWPPGKITWLADEGRISVETNLMGQAVAVTVLSSQIIRT